MFEGYAADLLAATLGNVLDISKDKLRISLWGGEALTWLANYLEPALFIAGGSVCGDGGATSATSMFLLQTDDRGELVLTESNCSLPSPMPSALQASACWKTSG